MTPYKTLIQPAQKKDIPILVTHYRCMFMEIGRLQKIKLSVSKIREMEINYAEKLKTELKNGVCKAWVIKNENKKVLASAAITMISHVPVPNDLSYKAAYLHSVYTEKRFRKKGYAGMIIKEAIDYCKAKGINRMLLNTSHAGKSLYEKIGFELSDNSMRLWIK